MRTVVVVPTYQEAENITAFLTELRNAVPEASVVVVDDSSPDGTGDLAERASAELGQIEVLHRSVKDGLGNAYRTGFRHVLADPEIETVVQMDVDFSHDPSVIPTLVGCLENGADCSIGSRYVNGGSTPNWPLHRRLLSQYGNRYTAVALRLPIRDATSGFRAYRRSTLERIDVASTQSTGYAFMSEIARRMVAAGMRIDEVPITFRDRAYGTSKMSTPIIVESMLRVTRVGIGLRLGRHV